MNPARVVALLAFAFFLSEPISYASSSIDFRCVRQNLSRILENDRIKFDPFHGSSLPARAAVAAAFTPMKILVSPIYVPARLVSLVKDTVTYHGLAYGWFAPVRFVMSDKALVASLVSLYGGLVYFTSVSSDFHKDMKPLSPNDVVAVIWLHEDEEASIDGYVKGYYSDQNHVIVKPANSVYEMDQILMEIRKEHGPISRLEIHTHGCPGQLSNRGQSLDVSDFKSKFSLKGALKQGAEVSIMACSTGRGVKGVEFMKAVGDHFLPAGGKVFASKILKVRSSRYDWILDLPASKLTMAVASTYKYIFSEGGHAPLLGEDSIQVVEIPAPGAGHR